MAISTYLRELRELVGHRLVLIPSVTALVFDLHGRLLVVRLAGDRELWALPGGAVDPDEEPEAAVVREAFEETGLHVAVDRLHAAYGGPRLRVTYPNGDEGAYVMATYVCRHVGGTARPDGEEVVEVRWVTREEAASLPMPPWAAQVVPRAFGAISPREAPPLRIETERLVVRPLEPGDAPALWDAIESSRAHLAAWMDWVERMQHPDDVRRIITVARARWSRREDFAVASFDRADGALVGGAGIHLRSGYASTVELGYWIRADRSGAGLVTECVAALTHAAFDLPWVERVEVRMDPRNERSRAVPERLGFVLDGTLRRTMRGPDGAWRDSRVYALVRGDALPPDPRLLA